jgi:hypothetical protein
MIFQKELAVVGRVLAHTSGASQLIEGGTRSEGDTVVFTAKLIDLVDFYFFLCHKLGKQDLSFGVSNHASGRERVQLSNMTSGVVWHAPESFGSNLVVLPYVCSTN